MELGPRIIFTIGNVHITETVIFSLIISLLIILFAYLATRKMELIPKGFQAYGELIVGTVYHMVEDTMGKENLRFAPYIGTLFLFLAFGSTLGILELRPVTADLNCTVPLAAVSFFMIHYSSIKAQTLKGYIKHLGSPYAFMLPLNVMSEMMFPVTLACRIFGNILAGVIVMSLLFTALESFSESLGTHIPFLLLALPLPLNFFFDMFEAGLQAFIFVMLTMVFTSNGIRAGEEHE
jgi:F-type H+-transporting ATPase subunit a